MDGRCHNIWLNYYSSVLCCAGVKCGLLCKNDDRPFPPTTLRQQGLGCNCYTLELSKLYFFGGGNGGGGRIEYVLAALAAELEWVKGNRLFILVSLDGCNQMSGDACSHFVSPLPPAMSSSSSCI